EDERRRIDSQCAATGSSVAGLLEEVGTVLSGLSQCTGLVLAPKTDSPLRHIEFVSLNPGRALVVLVTESGIVENRIIEVPHDLPPSALVHATNYLCARLVGNTVSGAYDDIMRELEAQRAQLDELTTRVVESGLATWAGGNQGGSLIV